MKSLLSPQVALTLPWIIGAIIHFVMATSSAQASTIFDWVNIYRIDLRADYYAYGVLVLLLASGLLGVYYSKTFRRDKRYAVGNLKYQGKQRGLLLDGDYFDVISYRKTYYSFAVLSILVVSVWMASSVTLSELFRYISGTDALRYQLADRARSAGFVGVRLIQSGMLSLIVISCIELFSRRSVRDRHTLANLAILLAAFVLLLVTNLILSQRQVTVVTLITLSVFLVRANYFSGRILLIVGAGLFGLWVLTEYLTHLISAPLDVQSSAVMYGVEKLGFYFLNDFHNFSVIAGEGGLLLNPSFGGISLSSLLLSRVFGSALISDDFSILRELFGGGTPTLYGLFIADFGFVAVLILFLLGFFLTRLYFGSGVRSQVLYAYFYSAVLVGLHSPMVASEIFVFNLLILWFFLKKKSYVTDNCKP